MTHSNSCFIHPHDPNRCPGRYPAAREPARQKGGKGELGDHELGLPMFPRPASLKRKQV